MARGGGPADGLFLLLPPTGMRRAARERERRWEGAGEGEERRGKYILLAAGEEVTKRGREFGFHSDMAGSGPCPPGPCPGPCPVSLDSICIVHLFRQVYRSVVVDPWQAIVFKWSDVTCKWPSTRTRTLIHSMKMIREPRSLVALRKLEAIEILASRRSAPPNRDAELGLRARRGGRGSGPLGLNRGSAMMHAKTPHYTRLGRAPGPLWAPWRHAWSHRATTPETLHTTTPHSLHRDAALHNATPQDAARCVVSRRRHATTLRAEARGWGPTTAGPRATQSHAGLRRLRTTGLAEGEWGEVISCGYYYSSAYASQVSSRVSKRTPPSPLFVKISARRASKMAATAPRAPDAGPQLERELIYHFIHKVRGRDGAGLAGCAAARRCGAGGGHGRGRLRGFPHHGTIDPTLLITRARPGRPMAALVSSRQGRRGS